MADERVHSLEAAEILRALASWSLFVLVATRCSGWDNSGEYVVVVDPGHGGANIGAVTRGGLCEKNLTLDLGLRLKELLIGAAELVPSDYMGQPG